VKEALGHKPLAFKPPKYLVTVSPSFLIRWTGKLIQQYCKFGIWL